MTEIRVVDVENLGWDFALCEIEGESILFVDARTSHEERIEVLTDAMAGAY